MLTSAEILQDDVILQTNKQTNKHKQPYKKKEKKDLALVKSSSITRQQDHNILNPVGDDKIREAGQ